MVDTTAAFVGDARMRTVIARKPIRGGMARGAIQTKHAGMELRIAVTTHARGVQPLELPAGMTALASHVHMRAGQREVAAAVVKGGILPIRGVMAGGAVRAELTVVFVILAVTGIAVGGCAFVHVIYMALFTAHFRVFAFQFEGGEIVVKQGGRPAVHRVTGGAVPPEASFMRLVGRMTGIAILRGGGKVFQAAGVHMAFDAVYAGVFSAQFEGKGVMIETAHEAVHAVMASEA